MDHLEFSEIEVDSPSAILLRMERKSSLSIEPVFIFSFSKKIGMFKLWSLRTRAKQSVVFREKRLMDFVITKSIFLASQSAISLCMQGLKDDFAVGSATECYDRRICRFGWLHKIGTCHGHDHRHIRSFPLPDICGRKIWLAAALR